MCVLILFSVLEVITQTSTLWLSTWLLVWLVHFVWNICVDGSHILISSCVIHPTLIVIIHNVILLHRTVFEIAIYLRIIINILWSILNCARRIIWIWFWTNTTLTWSLFGNVLSHIILHLCISLTPSITQSYILMAISLIMMSIGSS